MVELPSRHPDLRQALARNRLLHDVLADEDALEHDARVRARCHAELRAIVVARRRRHRWQGLAAAAAIVATIAATIPRPATRVVPAVPAASAVPSTAAVRAEPSSAAVASALVTVPTAQVAPSLLILTAPGATGYERIGPVPVPAAATASSPAFASVATAGVAADHLTITTLEMRVTLPILDDDQLLALPRVVALHKVANGQAWLSFSAPEPSGARARRR